jgi:hypothetical protein
MKRFALAVVAFGLVATTLAVPAFADPTSSSAPSTPTSTAAGSPRTATAGAPSTFTMPTQTIFGRPDKPMVAIVVRTPTAADAAGAAHERLRDAVLARSEPSIRKTSP